MSCYMITLGEAIVTSIAEKAIKKHEEKSSGINNAEHSGNKAHGFSCKLGWLNKMLWGGSGLLAFEHIWHGELSPFFPFLTAASNPADTAEMLHEMATTGTSMALLVTAVWIGIVFVTDRIEKHSDVPSAISETVGEASA